MAKVIDEFLYRRFIQEENRGGDFHVILYDDVTRKYIGPLTPTQAERDHGVDMSPIIGAMASEAVRQRDAAQSEIIALKTTAETVAVEMENIRATADKYRQERNEAVTLANALADRVVKLEPKAVVEDGSVKAVV